MNFEIARVVVLLAEEELTQEQADELAALVETIREYYLSRPSYLTDRRGVHALERVRAREEKREPDYAAAERAYVTEHGKEPS